MKIYLKCKRYKKTRNKRWLVVTSFFQLFENIVIEIVIVLNEEVYKPIAKGGQLAMEIFMNVYKNARFS